MRSAAPFLLALALLPAAAAAQQLAPLAGADGRIHEAWREAKLPQQKFPSTRYAIETVDGRPVLRMDADGSYGNLVHELRTDAQGLTLAWRWRVERFAEGADLRRKEGDDNAAKVCVFFDLPLERVPFLERQLLRLARSKTGENLPAATVCYVWDRQVAAGSVVPNTYSRRMRYLVLRSAETGRWHEEKRDVAADFLKLFGDESSSVPPVIGVAVGADADNTQGRSLAFVADPVLSR